MAGPVTDPLWPEIAKAFSNRAFMRVSPSWFSGLGDRAGVSRLERMQTTRAAKTLTRLTAGLSRTRLQRLLVMSEVNQEQAVAALRLTLVANISIPVGFLVLFNQFQPGSIQKLIESTSALAIIVPLVMVLTLLVGVLWFAYAGVDASRDLNHLLRLNLADTLRPAGEDDEAPDALEVITDMA